MYNVINFKTIRNKLTIRVEIFIQSSITSLWADQHFTAT